MSLKRDSLYERMTELRKLITVFKNEHRTGPLQLVRDDLDALKEERE